MGSFRDTLKNAFDIVFGEGRQTTQEGQPSVTDHEEALREDARRTDEWRKSEVADFYAQHEAQYYGAGPRTETADNARAEPAAMTQTAMGDYVEVEGDSWDDVLPVLMGDDEQERAREDLERWGDPTEDAHGNTIRYPDDADDRADLPASHREAAESWEAAGRPVGDGPADRPADVQARIDRDDYWNADTGRWEDYDAWQQRMVAEQERVAAALDETFDARYDGIEGGEQYDDGAAVAHSARVDDPYSLANNEAVDRVRQWDLSDDDERAWMLQNGQDPTDDDRQFAGERDASEAVERARQAVNTAVAVQAVTENAEACREDRDASSYVSPDVDRTGDGWAMES